MSPTGPFDVAKARPVTTHSLYSGRVAHQRDGGWALLGFHNPEPHEPFPGVVSDPIPVELDASGYPNLATMWAGLGTDAEVAALKATGVATTGLAVT